MEGRLFNVGIMCGLMTCAECGGHYVIAPGSKPGEEQFYPMGSIAGKRLLLQAEQQALIDLENRI